MTNVPNEESTTEVPKRRLWPFAVAGVALVALVGASLAVCANLSSLDDPCRDSESVVVAAQNQTDRELTLTFGGQQVGTLQPQSSRTITLPVNFDGERQLVAAASDGEVVYSEALEKGRVRDLCHPSARLMISD